MPNIRNTRSANRESRAIKEKIGGALRIRSHRTFSAALMAARSLGLAAGFGSAGWLPL